MKVLFVIDSLGSGGAERSTALIQLPLRELGVETSVATLYRAADGDEQTIRDAGIPVHLLNGRNDLQRLSALRRLIREIAPTVVHTCLYRSDQIGRWSTIGMGVPVVSSLVNMPRRIGRAWVGYPPRVKLVPAVLLDVMGARFRSSVLHAVTQGVADEYSSYFRLPAKKFRVVERGRPSSLATLRTGERRARVRAELGVPRDAPLIVSVGRIDLQKQHSHLVIAAGRVMEQRPDLRVVIAGSNGDGSRELQRALESVGSKRDAFLVTGYRSDVTEIVAAADLFVLHSRNEGAAGAAIEALGIGTCVLSYPLRGLDGVLIDGINSMVTPSQTPDSLADGIMQLLTDRELAAGLARAGQADFFSKFELRASARRLLDVYEEVAAPLVGQPVGKKPVVPLDPAPRSRGNDDAT